MGASTPAGPFREVYEAALAVRLVARWLIIFLAAAAGVWKGPMWAVGVLVGGLVIELNLDAFISFVLKARPGRLSVPLWLTVVKFNLAFVLTVAVCVLVIKFRLGDPLAFLFGLLVFLPAIVAGMFRYGILREKAARLSEKAPRDLANGVAPKDDSSKDDFPKDASQEAGAESAGPSSSSSSSSEPPPARA
ncbi:MAG: ATP synthase subunit I [Deltaproteobacteria bacterium]|jgi:hypothetical protein|nr:ATP synthase subunit I [Deltaproteobacteria bacterium]